MWWGRDESVMLFSRHAGCEVAQVMGMDENCNNTRPIEMVIRIVPCPYYRFQILLSHQHLRSMMVVVRTIEKEEEEAHLGCLSWPLRCVLS